MSEWLEEARRAARDVGEARPLDAVRTRVKIARTVARRARGRWRAPWIGLAAAALVGGTAWASGGDGARLVAWLRAEVSPARAGSVAGASVSPASVQATSNPQANVRPEPEEWNRKIGRSEESRTSPSTPVSDATRALDAPRPTPKTFRSSDLPLPNKIIGQVEANGLPRGDQGKRGASDARLYAEAHALHFVAHDPARALAAWDRYLAAAPDDTRAGLVLEARYNRAICLVRLGKREAARTALGPFASGAYGGYRQEDARALLDAPLLRAPEPSDDDVPRKTF